MPADNQDLLYLKALLPELSEANQSLLSKFSSNVQEEQDPEVTINKDQLKFLYENYRYLEWTYLGIWSSLNQKWDDGLFRASYVLAIYLHYISKKLLDCPQDVKKYENDDLSQYQKLMTANPLGYHIEIDDLKNRNHLPLLEPTEESQNNEKYFFSQWASINSFRTDYFIKGNNWRLLTGRMIRVFNTLSELYHNSTLKWAVDKMSYLNAYFLQYLSYVYYALRLIPNLFLLARHVIPNHCMSKEEELLGWQLRLKVQWKTRRGFQLMNDGVWGVINFSVVHLCSKALGATLNASLYLFDVLNCLWDLSMALDIRKKIKTRLERKDSDEELVFSPELQKHILSYSDQKVREKDFALKIAVVLFVLMIPVVSVLPQSIPLLFICAGLVLVTHCLFMRYKNRYEAKRPKIAQVIANQSAIMGKEESSSSPTSSSSSGRPGESPDSFGRQNPVVFPPSQIVLC